VLPLQSGESAWDSLVEPPDPYALAVGNDRRAPRGPRLAARSPHDRNDAGPVAEAPNRGSSRRAGGLATSRITARAMATPSEGMLSSEAPTT
jgi:hypothetical protein